MKKVGNETAAICGIFCATCPSYNLECDGCLSDDVAAGCDTCMHGFRECAKEHNVTRCYECSEFSCERLESFSKKHIVNGICHHENIIKDLTYMKEHSVEEWVKKQVEENTCEKCGKIIEWSSKNIHNCRE